MLTLSVSGVNALCTAGRAECDSEGPESRNNNNHKPPTVISLGNLLDIWTYFDQSEPKNFKLPKKQTNPTTISAHKVLLVMGSKKLWSFPAAQT